MNALAALRPFARGWRAIAPAGARCQLCAQAIPEDGHAHFVDLDRRALLCCCPTCAALDGGPRQRGSFRLVPKRILKDPAFTLDEASWDRLEIPVRLAFVFFNAQVTRWIALYPSPAGATESTLLPDALESLAAATPLVGEVEPDVEALLIRGVAGRPFDCLLVPIDACYGLVGRLRLHWRGFHGGDRAHQEIESFFVSLRERARSIRERAPEPGPSPAAASAPGTPLDGGAS